MSDLTTALLPTSWLEDTFNDIWLTIVEAGRWDATIGSTVASVRERERDVVRDLIDPSGAREMEGVEPTVDLVLALVHGVCATPMAERSTTILTGLDAAC